MHGDETCKVQCSTLRYTLWKIATAAENSPVLRSRWLASMVVRAWSWQLIQYPGPSSSPPRKEFLIKT